MCIRDSSNAAREAAHKGYRSDTMILCSFDFTNNRLNMISVPRDTRTKVNKLDYDTGEVVDQTTNRINTAYTFGGGPDHYGAQNAMDCMEEFLSCDGEFDIPIDYYVSIDLDGLPKLAESLGGVEVVLDRTLRGIGKKGQVQRVPGKKTEPGVKVALPPCLGRAGQRPGCVLQIRGEGVKAVPDAQEIQFILILKIVINDPL